MSEYEERRPPAPSLYQTFAEVRGSNRVGSRNRRLWVAAGLKRLTENELSDFSRLWHDGCGETIIEAQNVDRNHSPEI